MRGQDLTTSTTIDFIDGVKGTTIKLQLRNGAEPTSIKIPAGVNDGHSRVSNRNPSYYRGPQDPNHPWYHVGFRVARNDSVAAAAPPGIAALVCGPSAFEAADCATLWRHP